MSSRGFGAAAEIGAFGAPGWTRYKSATLPTCQRRAHEILGRYRRYHGDPRPLNGILGVVDGVTTNPSLVMKSGTRNFKEVVAEICEMVAGPVSAETVANRWPRD